jgi:hypothetical protein
MRQRSVFAAVMALACASMSAVAVAEPPAASEYISWLNSKRGWPTCQAAS